MATAVPATTAAVWWTPPSETDRFLPEGPRVILVSGRLAIAWVNIQTGMDATAGAVHLRFLDTGEHRVIPLPGRPGMLLPTDHPDVLLIGMGKEIGQLHLLTGQWEPLARIPDDNPRTIINDGEIVPGGDAVLFGTKDVQFADPLAELYLFTLADGTLTRLAGGQVCSNGKVFGPECGITLYDIDTPKRIVARYRLDRENRQLISAGTAIELRQTAGFPDGMCDVGDGTVIVAFYNPDPVPAGRAGRYRLDTGELVEEWLTPGSPRVTCPLLMQVDGAVKLLLTTATEGMPAAQRELCPNAGCLFLAETTLTAIPETARVRMPTRVGGP
ncbi:MAG: SMP-30/gluconolactonase/LRE family protein [Bacteroidales bacterium]|nr:SMP-30/gluconolactonase/LRE family protein [Bacteroidales bacterium]